MTKIKYNKCRIDRVGEISTNTQGCSMEIIESFSSIDNTVLFKDFNKTIIHNITYKEFKNGNVKNNNLPSVIGIGYLGYGKYTPIINKKAYNCWRSILRRCYDKKAQLNSKNKSYVNSNVCQEWHNFQIFAEWFENNYIDGFEIDKDILLKGNKIYSPEMCCFVPQDINIIFCKLLKNRNCLLGVTEVGNRFRSEIRYGNIRKYLGTFNTKEEAFKIYKTKKEQYIKEVADKWQGKITEESYKALYNYKIEIND